MSLAGPTRVGPTPIYIPEGALHITQNESILYMYTIRLGRFLFKSLSGDHCAWGVGDLAQLLMVQLQCACSQKLFNISSGERIWSSSQ